MLGSQQSRRTVLYSGVLRSGYVLYCVIVILLVFLQNPVICEEAQCTKSTLRDHLRKSFKVLKLGRTRSIKSCISLCCSRRNCDLALLRRTRCYGISCSHHDLCRGIMNGLREKRHEISKRSILDTDDVPSDFTQDARHHGFCRHRRIVPHHVFIEGGRGVSIFRKLARDVRSSKECNKYCCQRTDCSLAFIMREKCYGIICPDDGDCESGEETRVPLHLEIALLQKRGSIDKKGEGVDPDMESSRRSERRHYHHHHHHQEDSNEDVEHETHRPKTHRHLQDTSRTSLHHNRHRHHKSTFEPELRESHRHSSSHHKKKYHRHHHENENKERTKTERMHHHHHHRIVETTQDGDRDSEEEFNLHDEENSNLNRNKGHHTHDQMNSFTSNEDETDKVNNDNQDEETDISREHKIKQRKHHKHTKSDFTETTKDENEHVPLKKKHKMRLQHNLDGSSEFDESNGGEEEQFGSERRKKGSSLKHHHHEDEDNNEHEGTSEDNNVHEDIPEEDNNDHEGKSEEDNNDHEGTSEEDNNEHEGISKEDNNDHESTSEEDNNEHEGTSKGDNNEHEGTSEDNNVHKGTSENNNDHKGTSQDIADDKDDNEDDEEEKVPGKQDVVDHENNFFENLKHERRKDEEKSHHDDNDQNEDANTDDEKASEEMSRKSKHSKVEFDGKKSKHNKKHHQGGRESSPGESRNRENENESDDDERSNEQNDNSLDDDAKLETEKEQSIENKKSRHKIKDGGEDKQHDDEEMNEDDQIDAKRKKGNRRKMKDGMDSNEKEDENINNVKMKKKRKMHRKKEKKKEDYNHDHHQHHHHHHADNIEDENEENTNEMKNHRKKNVDYNHHHRDHHHQQHEDNVQDQDNKNTEQNKKKRKEEHEMNSDTDINEMGNANEEMNEHRHHHHHHHQKTKKKHQEEIEDKHGKDESEDHENSGSSDTSDTEDIMSQDYRVDKSNNLHEAQKHSHNHDDTVQKHHHDNDDKHNIKDHDFAKDENDKSSEKETKDVYENKQPDSKEKEKSKIGKIEGEDKNNQEGDDEKRSESKSKPPIHHESDKDVPHENAESDKENKTKKSKLKESMSKKNESKTSKTEQDYDIIHDDDLKENSKNNNKEENSNTKDKDKPAKITDKNRTFNNHNDGIRSESKHHNKDKASHLSEQNNQDYDHNSEGKPENNASRKMKKEHGDSKDNEHQVKKNTKNNSVIKHNEHRVSKKEKDKFEKEDSSQNTEGRNQTEESDLEQNHNKNNHRRKNIQFGDRKKEEGNMESSMDRQLEHKSSFNHESKEDYGGGNKQTDNRSSDVDNSEDNKEDDDYEKNGYNSKDAKHHELIHKEKGKHHAENSDHEQNHNNDQSNREKQNDTASEKHGHNSKDTLHHGEKGKHQIEKHRAEKLHHAVNENHDDDQSRTDHQKDIKDNTKNAHHHFQNNSEKAKQDFEHQDQENENRGKFNHKNKSKSKNHENNGKEINSELKHRNDSKDHKKSKSDEIKHNDARVISSDHADHEEGSGKHKEKNESEDNGTSGGYQQNHKSRNKNRKENKTNKIEDKEESEGIKDDIDHKEKYEKHKNSNGTSDDNGNKDTDGIRRNHVDHVTPLNDVKKYTDGKNITETTKDENTESTKEFTRESLEENQHGSLHHKIGNMKDNNGTIHSEEKTVIPFEERTKHSKKKMHNNDTTDETRRNGSDKNQHRTHKHPMDKKFNNNVQENNEPKEVKNEKKFNVEDTKSSKKTTKIIEPKIRNKSYYVKEKSEKGRTGNDEEKKAKGAVQHVENENGLQNNKTNVNERHDVNRDQDNNLPRINDNTNNNTQSLNEEHEKHMHKNIGESFSGGIKDIMDRKNQTSDTSNTGYPTHKPSLYHSLKDMRKTSNDTRSHKPKDKTEAIQPEVSNVHDIMKTNQNYTAKITSENPRKSEESDKTRFFNQETREWKESLNGDNVDDGGKYFNQRTRDWSVRQPKTNTEYFHNLTSQWNLQNKTKPSDFGKYFNQRTKTWLANKVTQQNSNNTNERGNKKISNTTELIQGNQAQDTRKVVSSTKDNQRKHKQNVSVHVEHKIPSIIPTHNQEKLLPPEVIHSKTNAHKFNHSKTSSTKVTQSVTKVKSAPHKIEDTESTEEKVKNEILQLIGESPTSPHKKTQNIDGLMKKHWKTSMNVSSHVNEISLRKPQDILQPKIILQSPKNVTETLPQHLPKMYKPHTLGHNKIFDSKVLRGQRKQKVLKASKISTKAKSRESFGIRKPPQRTPMSFLPQRNKKKYRVNSLRKQKTAPILKHPQTLIKPKQPLAIPISRHFKLPKIRKNPFTHANINRVSPTRLPSVYANTWKSTLRNPYSPTVSSIQNWNKQNNIFDDEWKNSKWNSYYTYGSNAIMQTPTVGPTISWNRMAWNSNRNSQTSRITSYPNGGMVGTVQGVVRPTLPPITRKFPLTINGVISGTDKNHGIKNTPRVLQPTLAPRYGQGQVPLDRNSVLIHGGKYRNSALVTKPTITPKYIQGEFPLTKTGDTKNSGNDYWSQNVKLPYRGQVSSSPVGTITPRRNYVYASHNVNKPPVVNQSRKPASSQMTRSRTFVRPITDITSPIPRKNAPGQPASIKNNYLKPNKVLSSGKINTSKGKKSSNTIPKQVNILRKPTRPVWNIAKPKQRNKTSTTTIIQQPFKVNKVERLHGRTTAKAQLHRKVPRGCYPGEIMSEMTLENGLDAGNYTNLGPTELMDSCINKCCETNGCEVAVQMDNVCFALECHSKDSCKIKSTLGKASHHKLCFISRKKKERQSIFDFGNDILGEQEMCHKEQAVGLSWKTTNAGTFDEIPCPKKAKGVARRKCSIKSRWLLPDFSSCVTNEYEDLYQRAKRLVFGEDPSSLLQSLAVVTTRTIDNSLIFGGDLKKTTEIMTSLVQEQGARQEGGMNQKDVKNYLITCSNLLDDSNKQEWRNIQQDARGSADILRDSQTYALIASSKLPETQVNVTYVTNNIVVQINYEQQGSKEKIFPDYTNSDVAMWDGEKDNIKLPASVFSIGNIKTATFSYKTLPALLPMDSNEHFRHSEPNSKILATIVEPRIQDKITPAVTITLHHLKQNRMNPRCVYWDFNLNPTHGGAWSTEGCWLESSAKEYTICRCDHLANFAVLMDVVDSDSMQVSNKDERYSKEMAAMWICAPVLVVLIIAALYIASTWSRGPRRRAISEKTSLLRSSVTTDEMRYDYSSTPSHNLEAATQSLNEVEWHYKFDRHIMKDGHEMDHDSGIESNDHDDSSTHCDLSLSQETLRIDEVHFQEHCEDITSPQSDILEYTATLLNTDSKRHVNLNRNFSQENRIVHLDVERKIFSTNLRRCCGNENLSSIQSYKIN